MILNIYIGFDTRNDGQMLAYEICKKSIINNTKHEDKIKIHKLVKRELESKEWFCCQAKGKKKLSFVNRY